MFSVVVGLTILIMVVGVIGCLIPVVPGNVLIGLSAVGFAWWNNFELIGVFPTVILVLVSLVGATSDIWMPMLGAKSTGASGKAILGGIGGATIGFILGAFVLGIGALIGALLGYFLGIFAVEYNRVKDTWQAAKAGIGGVVGWGITTVVQFLTGLGVFIAFVWMLLPS